MEGLSLSISRIVRDAEELEAHVFDCSPECYSSLRDMQEMNSMF